MTRAACRAVMVSAVWSLLGWAFRASADDLSQYRLDLSVPDVPAFTALGVSPSKVSQPSSPKDVVSAVSSGISADGHVQAGLALEIAPQKLVANAGILSDPTAYAWAGGLRLSLATNSSATNGLTTNDAALGGRWSFLSYQPEGDSAFRQCIDAVLPAVPEFAIGQVIGHADGSDAGDPDYGSAPVPHASDDITNCRRAFRAAHLAQWGLEVAAFHVAEAVGDSKLASFHPANNTGWVSVAIPVNSFAPKWDFSYDSQRRLCGTDSTCVKKVDQRERNDGKAYAACSTESCKRKQDQKRLSDAWLLALEQTQATWKNAFGFQPTLFARVDQRPIPTTSDHEVDVFVAARLPLYSDKWSVFGEGGYKRMDVSNKVKPNGPSNSLPLGFGGDLQLSGGTWLGVFFGADAISGELFSLGNLKWSLGETRPYELPHAPPSKT